MAITNRLRRSSPVQNRPWEVLGPVKESVNGFSRCILEQHLNLGQHWMNSRNTMKMVHTTLKSKPNNKSGMCFPCRQRILGSLVQSMLVSIVPFLYRFNFTQERVVITARSSFVKESRMTVANTLTELVPNNLVTEMYLLHKNTISPDSTHRYSGNANCSQASA